MSGRLAELLGHPGVEETLRLGSRFGVTAYHGGNLERGTDQIATAVADATGASLYTVCQPLDLRRHIPSTAFVPEESPALAEFLDHVDVVLTIHGYGRRGMWTHLLLGGRNRELAGRFGHHLRRHLPDYTVVDDVDGIPEALRGQHRSNPVNLPAGEGVQLELPPRVRGWGPHWRHHTDGWPTPHTAALVEGLVATIDEWS